MGRRVRDQESMRVSHENANAMTRAINQDWPAQLRKLTAELEAAMDAAAANRLSEFQACVERQLLLCHGLSSLALQSIIPTDRSASEQAAQTEQLRTAAATLRATNERYAAFLRHSGRMLRMFSTLERSDENYLPGALGAVFPSKAGQSNWSCEG
jgi:hypothetical protein